MTRSGEWHEVGGADRMKTGKREKPFKLDMGFGEAVVRLANTDPRELTAQKPIHIRSVASKMGTKLLTPEQTDRLFKLACDWFDRSQAAWDRGDMSSWRVASLAHGMIAAAHRELIGERG